MGELLAHRTRLGITQAAGPAGPAVVRRVLRYSPGAIRRLGRAVSPQAVLLFSADEAGGDRSGRELRRIPPGDVPCMAVAAREIPAGILREAESAGAAVFSSFHDPFLLHSRLIGLFRELGGRTVMVHGVLVRILGLGVLILGESGIGKTASGLSLMHSDHRWVADDAVVLEARGDTLYGRGHERSREWIAVRGRGILQAEALLGRDRLLKETRVDRVVHLTSASGGSGDHPAFRSWAGVPVPRRDLAAQADPLRTADLLLDCIRGWTTTEAWAGDLK